MDEGDLNFPNEQMLSCLDMTNAQSSCSFDMDEFLGRTQACNDALGRTEACADVFGRTQACTHAHACLPSGPDNSHTHTCIHVHTQIMPTPNDQIPSDDTAESVDKAKKRPLGNREAVRKYREKKKARTASLEDEVVRLRSINQQLMKRLQGQALLEAEIARLKCLLVDIRGRIEGEIGSFPYMKPTKTGDLPIYQSIADPNLPSTYMMNPCNVQGKDQQLYCLHPGSERASLNGQNLNDCEFDNLQSSDHQNLGDKAPGCELGDANGFSTGKASGNSTRRGTRVAKGS